MQPVSFGGLLNGAKMNLIPKSYIYAFVAVFLLLSHGLLSFWTFNKGRASAEAKLTKAERDSYAATLDSLRKEAAASREMNKALAEALASRPASTHTKETIRANPTACSVPEPVARSLRELAAGQDAARP